MPAPPFFRPRPPAAAAPTQHQHVLLALALVQIRRSSRSACRTSRTEILPLQNPPFATVYAGGGFCHRGSRMRPSRISSGAAAARHALVVRDEDDGRAALVERLHSGGSPRPRRCPGCPSARPQAAGAAGDQRPRDGHALLLAAAHLRGQVVAPVVQAHVPQRCSARSRRSRSGTPRYIRGSAAFSSAVRRQQVEVLEHEPDLPAAHARQSVAAKARHVLAVQGVIAAAGRVQAAEDVHQGGLPAAGRPDDGDKVPVGDLQAHPAQGLHRAAPAAVDLLQIPRHDQTAAPPLPFSFPAGGRPHSGECGAAGASSRSRSAR